MNAGVTSAQLVTAPGRGGIAVIVLTGEHVAETVEQVFAPRQSLPAGERLALGWIVDGHERLDEAVVSLHAGRAEINIHGGPQVARKVLSLLSDRGVQIAADHSFDPAFAAQVAEGDNPAIAAEMLSALALAKTPLAAAAVSAQWSGGLARLARGESPSAAALRRAADRRVVMDRLLTPAEVVIAGGPNVGKSALANAIVGREMSIVSDTPGATRDWVRSLADLDGVPVWLTDTAGLGAGAEGVEAEAARRAWERIAAAEVVICVTPPVGQAASASEQALLQRLGELPSVLVVTGKCDLAPGPGDGPPGVSARTFAGIPELISAIRRRLGLEGFDPAEPVAFTARQEQLLRQAADALTQSDTATARASLDRLLNGT